MYYRGEVQNKLGEHKRYTELLQHILISPKDNLKVEELNKLTEVLISTFKDNISALSCIGEMNKITDDEYVHCIKVALIALVIGRWNNYEEDKLRKLVLAGLLHDIGKNKEDNIDDKTNKAMENKIMANIIYKRHPIEGYEKLASLKEIDDDVLKAVLSHHEKCDGTGFPLALKGNRISDIANIVGLADTYDRLRQKMHILDVVKELTGTQMRAFELDILNNFCLNITNHCVGSSVVLNTGEIGRIVEIHPHSLYRPIIEIDDKIVDLYVESKITIEKVDFEKIDLW